MRTLIDGHGALSHLHGEGHAGGAAALLAGPALEAIDALLMTDNGTTSMLSGFSSGFGVHAVSFLLALVFAVISGGIPAWRISRRSIAAELKGRDI